MYYYLGLDIGTPTELSHLAYSILLAQLIPTLIHYSCTVALAGLADWSAFLGLVLLTMSIHVWDNGAHGGHQMGGFGVIFTPVLVTCLLGHPGLPRLMTRTLGHMELPNSPVGSFNPPPAAHPPPPPTLPPSRPPTPYNVHPWYYSSCEKSSSKSSSAS